MANRREQRIATFPYDAGPPTRKPQAALLGDVLAEVEARAGREAHRKPAILQQVVEQVVIHQVRLRADGDVLGKEHVDAAAEAVESGPVGLVSGGRQLA